MSTLFTAAVATLVFCAPGSPGGDGDSNIFMDQFAKAAVASAGWSSGSLAAIYDSTEQGGITKLGTSSAVMAFVPYPFYVEHASKLHLKPLAQAEVMDVGTQERWTLVGKAGGATGSQSMAGYTILSVAGYAPDFVRRAALGGWPVPAEVKIEATSQILKALRRAAAGEPVLVLLDQTQAKAVPTLPFAGQLKTLAQSPPLPVALVAVVDDRLSEARAKAFQNGLLKLGSIPADADTLVFLHLKGFVLPQLPDRTAEP